MMICLFKKLRLSKLKAKSYKLNKGMTYVELIVVLSIFSVMTSIVLFDYGKFQANVDIKILANDIASKIVEAQKYSISGEWNSNASSNWKPSYGLYFDISDDKSFIYFADLIQNNVYDSSSCPGTGECLDNISITKGNSVSELKVVGTGCPSFADNINILFKRPNSNAIITSTPALVCDINYAQITVSSPESVRANIKIYPSGRIQIN